MLNTVLALLAALSLQQAPAAPASPAPATLVVKTVDRSGSVLPGVTVKFTPAATVVVDGRSSVVESVVTRSSGVARLNGMSPGTYTLSIGGLSGFTSFTRPRSVLAAGQTLELTVTLELDRFLNNEDLPSIATLPNPVAPREVVSALAPGEEAVGVWTSLGTFFIAVDGTRAPTTAANFLAYVDKKLYDNGRFHRATRPDNYTPQLPNRPMMNIIQGGATNEWSRLSSARHQPP